MNDLKEKAVDANDKVAHRLQDEPCAYKRAEFRAGWDAALSAMQDHTAAQVAAALGRAAEEADAWLYDAEKDIVTDTRLGNSIRALIDAPAGSHLDALLEEAREQGRQERRERPDPEGQERCQKCGNPRNNHPFRHPFVSSAAIRARGETE